MGKCLIVSRWKECLFLWEDIRLLCILQPTWIEIVYPLDRSTLRHCSLYFLVYASTSTLKLMIEETLYVSWHQFPWMALFSWISFEYDVRVNDESVWDQTLRVHIKRGRDDVCQFLLWLLCQKSFFNFLTVTLFSALFSWSSTHSFHSQVNQFWDVVVSSTSNGLWRLLRFCLFPFIDLIQVFDWQRN